MRNLKWDFDENSAYWASKIKLPYMNNKKPVNQYDGNDQRLWEKTWLKHILKNKFPEFCYHSGKKSYLSCSVQNILRCLKEDNLLEALALIVQWGTMARVKNKKVYIQPLDKIQIVSKKCLAKIDKTNSIEDAWKLLTEKLGWSDVITSKYLHFAARSLGFEVNPPVPIDNKVMINQVWPVFIKKVKLYMKRRSGQVPPIPKKWKDQEYSFDAYNRYMTVVLCFANFKGWTTTQIENTIFDNYYPEN